MIAKLVVFFSSFGQLNPVPSAPQEIVTAMFAAFNDHDAAGMERLYAADAKLTSSDFCHPRSRADVARTYRSLFTAFPDIHDDVTTMVAQGDRVAVRFVAKSASGGMSLVIHTLLRVQEGKIVEDDSVFDVAGRPCAP